MSWFDKRLELLRFAYKMSGNELCGWKV